MKKVLIIGCLTFVVIAIVGVIALFAILSSPEFKESYDDSFKTGFVKGFVENCSKNYIPDANTVCTCLANHLVENNTSAQLTLLATKNNNDIGKIPAMQNAMKACLPQNSLQ